MDALKGAIVLFETVSMNKINRSFFDGKLITQDLKNVMN